MNRIGIGLLSVILVFLLGACASKEVAVKAPSSAAYEEAAAAVNDLSRPGAMTGAMAGRQTREEQALTGSREAVVQLDEKPREAMVQSDREPAAKPLVPAFPVGLNKMVLQDMRTVFFEFDSTTLPPQMRKVLDANSAWMLKHPGTAVRLIGHADERGTSEYNLGLGMRRANNVRDYLINKGIPIGKMVIVSYGEEMPLRRGHTEADWRTNRRVEFALDTITAQLRR